MKKQIFSNSFLIGDNTSYIENLYNSYLKDNLSVNKSWLSYFDYIKNNSLKKNVNKKQNNFINERINIKKLFNAYRIFGLKYANLNPIYKNINKIYSKLNYNLYGFDDIDIDRVFDISFSYFGFVNKSLKEVILLLRNAYCGNMGFEFMHLLNSEERKWWKRKIEFNSTICNFSSNKKKHILYLLVAAENFEKFLNTKYVGQKRFSIEGCESFIVASDEMVNYSSKLGIKEIIIGMAHRGRLNLLVNILGKKPIDIFNEFDGINYDNLISGDVKYHNGFKSNVRTKYGFINLNLHFNPSHLESINSVIEGSVRARMDCFDDLNKKYILPVQIHGDSSLTGQGIIMEILNFSRTRGYSTYGTLHIVINNQIGFTTSEKCDLRSSIYCTDISKMIDIPVIHVNGDDPESVVLAVQFSIDYRMKYFKDIIIDIVCFRKLGHNEQDTPNITQPEMYELICNHTGVRNLYSRKIIDEGIITINDELKYVEKFYKKMNYGICSLVNIVIDYKKNVNNYNDLLCVNNFEYINNEISDLDLSIIAKSIINIPKEIILHQLVKNVIDNRKLMVFGKLNIDWGMGEYLSMASLLIRGYSIRFSGQDSCRGTFMHRHSVLYNQNISSKVKKYIPLKNIYKYQGKFEIINSVLSEESVLGFEYGYSITNHNSLVIWEAQFGDFVNGAQVIIDQFISSGEVKWNIKSNLVVLLPHGYEGQGPEHSSARIERFLQLCSDNNMRIIQPTNPSQFFHLLRSQIFCLYKKPLIIFTPKSLLRNKLSYSSLCDIKKGCFNEILGETDVSLNLDNVDRLLICSGKIYYDLFLYRNKFKINNVSIIRIEQLYPFPFDKFSNELKKYNFLKEIVWVQDEPKNQGAWYYIKNCVINNLSINKKFIYSGRHESASTAVGFYRDHYNQQKDLIENSFKF